MSLQYICLNGDSYRTDEHVLSHHNRAFTYGDALFETIHCLGTRPQFLEKHWERLSQGMKILKMVSQGVLSSEIIEHFIARLLNRNRTFKGARIRLTVFRNEGGLYTPDAESVSWLMESTALENEKYELNRKGLIADIYDELYKPVNILSNLKTTNALIYVLAGIYKKKNGLDDCLILNQFGRLAETTHSNLFIKLDDRLITPPLSEGCISGTMRSTIIGIAREEGYVLEETGILEKYLLNAEEVFITNAIQGIQWIGTYREKRYFNFTARKLLARLNERAFQP